jgi:hypothetical protein
MAPADGTCGWEAQLHVAYHSRVISADVDGDVLYHVVMDLTTDCPVLADLELK